MRARSHTGNGGLWANVGPRAPASSSGTVLVSKSSSRRIHDGTGMCRVAAIRFEPDSTFETSSSPASSDIAPKKRGGTQVGRARGRGSGGERRAPCRRPSRG